MRNFISAASPSENGPFSRRVLWIHAPDYNRNGVLGDIRNVTNRETNYTSVWAALDDFANKYDNIALKPIQDKLDKHRADFVSAYESLDADQKSRYSKLLKGYEKVNPFDLTMVYKMLEVGLDMSTYHELIASF